MVAHLPGGVRLSRRLRQHGTDDERYPRHDVLPRPAAGRGRPGARRRRAVGAAVKDGRRQFRLRNGSDAKETVTFNLTTEWRRYEVQGTAEQGSRDRYLVELHVLSVGFVWIDLIQWAETE